jgi:hypothetical protein
MTTSYGQPEPFDPATLPPSLKRGKPKSKRPVLPIVGAVVLAAIAFAGGFGVANAVAPKATTTAGNGQGFDGQFGGPNASNRPRNGFGGGASGTIGSVSTDQMTVTTANGGQRIVLLTPTTTVTQVSSTTKALSDLTNGEQVTVVGSANPDGSVTATQVIIGNVGIFGRGFGGGRPDGSPAPTTAP